MEERRKMKERAMGASETIGHVLFGAALAVVIYIILGVLFGTRMPIIDVMSTSMEPNISRGDLAVLINGDAQIGDVIVFDTPSEAIPVIHRVIKINDDGTYQTLGDNNHGMQHDWEKQIEKSQIIGKVLFVIPYLGWVKIVVFEYLLPTSPRNLMLLAAVSALLYFAWTKKLL